MAKFYKLKIADVAKETPDCVSIAFDIPEELKEHYKFIQGQYVTFKMNFKGEELRRSYSVCSSPITDNELRIAVKKVKDGRASVYLNENIKPGDDLEVMTPMGNFYTELNPNHKKNYILFAGGSGITPMLSILKTTLHVEPNSKVILFYGNRDEASIIFKNQLDFLKEKYQDRLQIYHVMEYVSEATSDLFKGMMNKEKIKTLVRNYVNLNLDNEYFICGPTGMMNSAKASLEELKVDHTRIHIEYFTTVLTNGTAIKKGVKEIVDSEVTVILDGEEHTIQLKSNGDAILDAALNADLDVPFACKGAVCCTCRAKLIEGKVQMDMNYALTEEEVQKGYILTCQSHPITPKVVVDYDQA